VTGATVSFIALLGYDLVLL